MRQLLEGGREESGLFELFVCKRGWAAWEGKCAKGRMGSRMGSGLLDALALGVSSDSLVRLPHRMQGIWAQMQADGYKCGWVWGKFSSVPAIFFFSWERIGKTFVEDQEDKGWCKTVVRWVRRKYNGVWGSPRDPLEADDDHFRWGQSVSFHYFSVCHPCNTISLC